MATRYRYTNKKRNVVTQPDRVENSGGTRIVDCMAEGTCSIRDSTDADVDGIAQIYGYWVEHGLGSFELLAPPLSAIAERRAAILGDGFPYLVAIGSAGEQLGFAYASWHRTRPAYRFACEDSVYVSPLAVRRGVGRLLLSELVLRCTAMQLRLMVAVIGDSNNSPSIGLHRRTGFEMAGVLPSIGWKHGRWVDTVLMTRPLGTGNQNPPMDGGTFAQR